RREWRMQAVRGLLQIANSCPALYAAVRAATRERDAAKFMQLNQRMLGEQHLLSDAAWPALMGFTTEGEIAEFIAGEFAFMRTAAAALTTAPSDAGDPSEVGARQEGELIAAHNKMLTRLSALNQAAERYIFGGNFDNSRRGGIPLRKWVGRLFGKGGD